MVWPEFMRTQQPQKGMFWVAGKFVPSESIKSSGTNKYRQYLSQFPQSRKCNRNSNRNRNVIEKQQRLKEIRSLTLDVVKIKCN